MEKEERFLRLFVKNEFALAAMVRTYLPNWDAVDEVLQEASLVMWRKIHELEDDDDFLKWGRVIVHFEILKYRRKTQRDRHVLSPELVAKLMDESLEDEQTFSEKHFQAIKDCLKTFDESNRKLLLATHQGRGAIKEISQRIGRSANSLYKKLTRLRVKLHQCVVLKVTVSDS